MDYFTRAALNYALANPNSVVGVIAGTHGQAYAAFRQFREVLLVEIYMVMHGSLQWRLENGSTIQFGHAADYAEARKFLSYEFHHVQFIADGAGISRAARGLIEARVAYCRPVNRPAPLEAKRDALAEHLKREKVRKSKALLDAAFERHANSSLTNTELYKLLRTDPVRNYRANPGHPDEICARCGETLSKHAKVQPYDALDISPVEASRLGVGWVPKGSPLYGTPGYVGSDSTYLFRLVCPDSLFQTQVEANTERQKKVAAADADAAQRGTGVCGGLPYTSYRL